jgi:hypothetical protein
MKGDCGFAISDCRLSRLGSHGELFFREPWDFRLPICDADFGLWIAD